MNTSPDMVIAEIELRLVVTDGPDRAVNADVRYSPTDPYAVRVDFHTGSAEVVEWTFARSLLSDGVAHAVGEGDVHVWPNLTSARPRVCLSLSSPSGRAVFEAPLPRVTEFLARTYTLVPNGSESRFVDIDRELAGLLYD